MNVLLVQPKGVQAGFTRCETRLPPLGLLYIAACIRDIADMRLVDADARGVDDNGVLAGLDGWMPDLVGMTLSTLTVAPVRRFAAAAKAAHSVAVIVGGPLPTAAPDVALESAEFDMAAVGDGEPIMRDLCKRLSSGGSLSGIPGVFCRGDQVHPRRQAAELSRVPMPAWDLVPDFSHYWSPDCVQTPVTIIEAQRGCPYRCAFCSVPAISGSRRRVRSAESVLIEVEYLTGDRGIRELSFVDPDFMADREYAARLCEGIRGLQRSVTWFCNARVDAVNADLAREMARAGCHRVYVGLESGDPEILQRIHKRVDLGQAEDALAVLRDAGISVSAGFIVGFPFDTDGSVTRTIAFARRLKDRVLADSFQFSIFNWFPGVEIEMPDQSRPGGFHPVAPTRWVEWQHRAYIEVGQAMPPSPSGEAEAPHG